MKAIADKLIGLIIAVSLCLTVAACGATNNEVEPETNAGEKTSTLSID